MDQIKNLFSLSVIFLSGFFLTPAFAIDNVTPNSPIGYWKTIDDVTGRPKSIVHIWQANNQVLMGQVIKIFPKSGRDQNKLCTACQGSLHNQPIVGMVILSGLKFSENHWDQGKILDPENGKSYSCAVKLHESGRKLNVHGYVGLPLFGRSQTWERVDLMSDNDRYQG